jgi:glycosyltransferase involved in cell wall biosynthesis
MRSLRMVGADYGEPDMAGLTEDAPDPQEERPHWHYYEGEGLPPDAEPGKDYFKEGKAAKHATGTLLQGPWDRHYDGFSEHTRRLARALSDAGEVVHLRSSSPSMLPLPRDGRDIAGELGDLLTASVGGYSALVHHMVPNTALMRRISRPPHFNDEQAKAVNARRVFSTVWERRPDADQAKLLAGVGQCWVASTENQRVLREVGVDGVEVIPVPFFPDDPHLALESRPQTSRPPRFYMIGKWEPRKDFHRSIGAFMMAFAPGEAALLVKTGRFAPATKDYPRGPAESIREWLADPRVVERGWGAEAAREWVVVVTEMLDAEQLLGIHARCDVYLACSRGEGFGMPALDAKLAGNLMVCTESGPADFMGDADELVQTSGSVRCHPVYGWADQSYLDFEIEAMVGAFRNAAGKVRAGARRRGVDMSEFSAARVGEKMRRCLASL